LFLPLEGTLLFALVDNTRRDSAERPYDLVVLSGSGSTPVLDAGTPSQVRFVNASPGSYALDAFVNATSVDNTARQTCDPPTPDGTLLKKCALAFGAVGAFDALTPGTYDVKVQKTADDAVAATAFVQLLVAGRELTALVGGLVQDTATSTTVTLQTLQGSRPVATAAQLRIVDASLAGDAALAGDPTTDRLEFYISAACAGLEGESPDFANLVKGSDTGYGSYLAGDYQLTLTRTDTAASGTAPEVLLTKRVTLSAGKVYTLVLADSVGGVPPITLLSLDDDPGFADCPAP
jgi:hypothetical protein